MIRDKLLKSIKRWTNDKDIKNKSAHYVSRLPIYRILTEVDLSSPERRNSVELTSRLRTAGMENTNLDNYWKRVSFIAENCSGRVLEIGSGCGNITRYISQNSNVTHITAIDLQPEYIKQLRNFSFQKVDAVCADISKYDFKGKFDCVVMSEVIEHLSEEQEMALINRLRSCLNPGAIIIVTTPIGFMHDPDHVRGFSKTEFQRHLTQHYGKISKTGDNEVQQFAVIRWNGTTPSSLDTSLEWKELGNRLSKLKKIVDLGCGNNPHPKATVAVDAYLQPEHRGLGQGPVINAKALRNRGVHFIQSELSSLPFADKEFEFAYSHHAFEHLPDPKKACQEMCRIARAGAIITPSVFAEVAFGRPYHLWFVMARGSRLIFIRKSRSEDRPFGNHPLKDENGKFIVTKESNPFDVLLNDNGWYKGKEQMPRLSGLLRKYWYSHSPVMEVVFLWENSFECTVIHEDGAID